MQSPSLTVSTLFGFLWLVTWTTANPITCNSNSQCPYGYCDLESHACRCSLDCNSFAEPQYVCKDGHAEFSTECGVISEACQAKMRIPTYRVTLEVLISANFDCNMIQEEDFSGKVEFCKDQSYCSGNGICMEDTLLGNSYCRCNALYEGQRCNTRKPITVQGQPSVSKNSQASASSTTPFSSSTTPFSATSTNHGSSMFGPPVFSSIAGILACMMCACFVITHQKRNRNPPLKNKEEEEEEERLQDSHDDPITNYKTTTRNNEQKNYLLTDVSTRQSRKTTTALHSCQDIRAVFVSLPTVKITSSPNTASANSVESADRFSSFTV